MEWTIVEHATFTIGGITVPFYDTLGPDTVQFILEHTNLSVCVCTRSQIPALCEAASKSTNKLKTIVVIDGITPEAAQLVSETNNGQLALTTLAKVETVGAQCISTNRAESHHPPSPHDIATFCYTSGTTGNPKGALLSHQNMICINAGISNVFKDKKVNSTDRHLSYLPMPHVFERTVQSQVLMAGGSVAFFRGDPTKLIEDIQACQPTILPVAPRVLNKIYDKIMNGINAAGGMKKKLFDAGLAAKMEGLKQGHLTHTFYDALIFNKIKRALGMGSLRMVISGSAPLSPNVMYFFRCLLGIPVCEGYGQTEGCAGATLALPDDISTVGHVGGPVGGCEIKLEDVPEMKYLSTDTSHNGVPCRGRGEICVRGPNVFVGYYKEEEKTKETIDEDGWLHSGDIGLWNMEGNLQIIDRKKNIFKLAQGGTYVVFDLDLIVCLTLTFFFTYALIIGHCCCRIEYIAVEKIENVLTQSLLIGQAFVYGDSFQSSLVAIIVPDEEPVKNWAIDKYNNSSKTMEELCKSKELHDMIMNDVKGLAKKNGLHGFETPKAIFLEANPFTVENDLITPTFKLKRPQLREYYQKQIDEMYASMPPPPSKL